MKTTVLLTCYNHEKFISKAFENIIENIDLVDEIVVCDDYSSDESVKQLEEMLAQVTCKVVRIFNSENRGLNYVWNTALKSITGDIIICQSCDDMSSSDRIPYTLKYFKDNPDVEFLVTDYQFVNDVGEYGAIVRRKNKNLNLENLLRKGSSIPLFGMSFRREFIKILGALPIHITNEDDFIGFLAVSCSNVALVAECHYIYRIHDASMSNWVLSFDKKFVLENFIIQQQNRISNFQAIHDKLNSVNYNLSEFERQLISQRIGLHEKYSGLPELGLYSRLALLVSCRSVVNYRDLIIIIFGVRALMIIASLKRMRVRLSSK